jgi:hypothetical protein
LIVVLDAIDERRGLESVGRFTARLPGERKELPFKKPAMPYSAGDLTFVFTNQQSVGRQLRDAVGELAQHMPWGMIEDRMDRVESSPSNRNSRSQ